MNNLSRIFFIVISLLLVWVIYTGSLDIQTITIGLVASFVTSFFVYRYITFGIEMFSPLRVVNGLVFFLFYLIALVKANISIALIVLRPSLPINPSIVKAQTELKSDIGKAILADAITMTPGTLTLDVVGKDIYVHCVSIEKTDQKSVYESIILPFEKFLIKVFR